MEVVISPRTRELINGSAAEGAPYSGAVAFGDLVWTSGALPIRADGTVPTDFKEQVRTALENLEVNLHAAGAAWGTVVKINGYVLDIHRLPELNEVYENILGEYGAPARTTVEVSSFRGPTQVEFDAVAHRVDAGREK